MGKIKKKKSTILKNGGRRYTKHHFITNKRTRNVTIYEDVNHPTENVPIIKTNKSYVYGDDYITLPQFCWGNTSSEKLFSIEFSIGGMILSNSRQYLINRNFEIVCSTDGNFSIKIYLSISSIKATVTYGKHSCEVTCGYDLSKIDNSKDYRFRLECETNNQGQNCFNTYIRLASLDMEENSMTDGDEDISVPRNESVYGEGIKIKGIESTISFFLNIHSLEYRNTYPTESHIVYEPCCYYISNERYVGLYDDENSKLYTSNKCKKNTNKSNTSVSLLNIEEQGTFQKSHVETEEYTESSYGYYPNQQLSNIIEVEKPIWKNPPEYSFVTPYKDDKYLYYQIEYKHNGNSSGNGFELAYFYPSLSQSSGYEIGFDFKPIDNWNGERIKLFQTEQFCIYMDRRGAYVDIDESISNKVNQTFFGVTVKNIYQYDLNYFNCFCNYSTTDISSILNKWYTLILSCKKEQDTYVYTLYLYDKETHALINSCSQPVSKDKFSVIYNSSYTICHASFYSDSNNYCIIQNPCYNYMGIYYDGYFALQYESGSGVLPNTLGVLLRQADSNRYNYFDEKTYRTNSASFRPFESFTAWRGANNDYSSINGKNNICKIEVPVVESIESETYKTTKSLFKSSSDSLRKTFKNKIGFMDLNITFVTNTPNYDENNRSDKYALSLMRQFDDIYGINTMRHCRIKSEEDCKKGIECTGLFTSPNHNMIYIFPMLGTDEENEKVEESLEYYKSFDKDSMFDIAIKDMNGKPLYRRHKEPLMIGIFPVEKYSTIEKANEKAKSLGLLCGFPSNVTADEIFKEIINQFEKRGFVNAFDGCVSVFGIGSKDILLNYTHAFKPDFGFYSTDFELDTQGFAKDFIETVGNPNAQYGIDGATEYVMENCNYMKAVSLYGNQRFLYFKCLKYDLMDYPYIGILHSTKNKLNIVPYTWSKDKQNTYPVVSKIVNCTDCNLNNDTYSCFVPQCWRIDIISTDGVWERNANRFFNGDIESYKNNCDQYIYINTNAPSETESNDRFTGYNASQIAQVVIAKSKEECERCMRWITECCWGLKVSDTVSTNAYVSSAVDYAVAKNIVPIYYWRS